MNFFDANVMIGAHFAPYGEKFPDVSELLKEMDFFGIDESLVYYGLAQEYNMKEGNEKLLKEIATSPQLHPCWVVAPYHTNEMLPPKKLVSEMMRKGVKSARLFFGGPLSYGEMPDLVSYKELLATFNQHQIPLIVEFEQSTSLTAAMLVSLDSFIEQFPDLPFILSAPRINSILTRLLYPRLKKYKNLHIELSGYQCDQGIEEMVKRFGSERLIYGSRFPWYSIAQAKIYLAYARISEEDKKAIAGENLKHLLDKVK